MRTPRGLYDGRSKRSSGNSAAGPEGRIVDAHRRRYPKSIPDGIDEDQRWRWAPRAGPLGRRGVFGWSLRALRVRVAPPAKEPVDVVEPFGALGRQGIGDHLEPPCQLLRRRVGAERGEPR